MIKSIKQYTNLPATIYIVTLVNLINTTGNFVYPFLAIYLTSGMDINESSAGLIIMLFSASFVPGAILGGIWADTIGRKTTILISLFVKAGIFLICPFTHNQIIFITLLVIAGFFSGVSGPPFGALMADLTNKQNRNESFSLLYLGTNVGMAISPLLAGFLFKKYMIFLFIGDAITLLIGCILFLLFIPETLLSKKVSPNKERAKKIITFKEFIRTNSIITLFMVCLFIYYFIYTQHSFSLPIQVNEIFSEKGPFFYGILMSINAVFVLIFTPLITYLTKKNNPITNILTSSIFLAFGFGALYFWGSIQLLIISTLLWTIGEILSVTNVNVFVANNTSNEIRGRVNTILSLTRSAGMSLCPFITGLLISNYNISFVWPFTFIMSVILFLLLTVIMKKNREINQEKLSKNIS